MDRITPEEILRNPELYRKNEYRNGLWRARVVSVDDPERRGRVQVRVLQLHPESAPIGSNTDSPSVESGTLVGAPGEGVPDQLCPWAEPAFPFGGALEAGATADKTQGFIMLPEVGSTVWVGFDMGFTGRPVWLGAWLGQGELPGEFTSPEYIRLVKTPAGHLLLFDDTPGAEKILLAEATTVEGATRVRFLEMDKAQGKTTLHNGNPNTPNFAKLELEGLVPGAEIARLQVGASTFVVLQQALLTLQSGTMQFSLNPASQTIVLQAGTQILSLDLATATARLQSGPLVDITLAAGTVTIRAGANTIVVDNSTGTTTLTNSGDVSIVTPGNVTLAALGDIDLGAAGTGVMLDAFISLFNGHTHTETGTVTGPPNTTATSGVHSSSTVRAKP